MKNNYFIGIYWGIRKDSIEICSNNIYETLFFLRETDESFNFWYNTDKPRNKEMLKSLNIDVEAIDNLLLENMNYNDDGSINEELGYTFMLKSELEYVKSHILSITCGSYSQQTGKIPNTVNLTIQSNNIKNKSFSQSSIQYIYNKFNAIWLPDSGVFWEEN